MLNKKTQIFGRLICKYSLPLDEVEELNNVYDEHKKELISNGARLVGRIESELELVYYQKQKYLTILLLAWMIILRLCIKQEKLLEIHLNSM
jgi:hypothetical protein